MATAHKAITPEGATTVACDTVPVMHQTAEADHVVTKAVIQSEKLVNQNMIKKEKDKKEKSETSHEDTAIADALRALGLEVGATPRQHNHAHTNKHTHINIANTS